LNLNEEVGLLTYDLPSNAFETKHLCFLATSTSEFDLNYLYPLVGSTTNMLLKHYREECRIILQQNLPNDSQFRSMTIYTTLLNQGGLKHPYMGVLQIICNCELLYSKYKMYKIHNSSNNLISKIVNDLSIEFPACIKFFNIKQRPVEHFFTV